MLDSVAPLRVYLRDVFESLYDVPCSLLSHCCEIRFLILDTHRDVPWNNG